MLVLSFQVLVARLFSVCPLQACHSFQIIVLDTGKGERRGIRRGGIKGAAMLDSGVCVQLLVYHSLTQAGQTNLVGSGMLLGPHL